MSNWTAMRGVVRSLGIYRSRAHLASLTRFMAEAVPGPKLVFDIGAHVGDRVTAFRRNGARVVAVEPQPLLARTLKALFCLDSRVSVVETALGAAEGSATLQVNQANPTVSTLSQEFVGAADGAGGWEGQRWDRSLRVPTTTLDALIAEFGLPDFVKIDTEGHEAEVLAGLTQPIAALSFEITMIARAAGLEALEQTRRLGFTRYRLSLGERHAWDGDWIDHEEMAELIRTLPEQANSGDVYARRG